jgi:hypothetical protein
LDAAEIGISRAPAASDVAVCPARAALVQRRRSAARRQLVHQSVHDVEIIESFPIDSSQKQILSNKIGDPT